MRKTRFAGAVLGTPVDAVGHAPEDERRLRDRLAAGVRDADAAGQARRHRLLPVAHVTEEGVEIGAAPGRHEAFGQCAGRLVAIGSHQVKDDLLLIDE
jgi:hypothetical protein